MLTLTLILALAGGPQGPGAPILPCTAATPAGTTCRAVALPPCAPGLAPGAPCLWPADAVSLPVHSGPLNTTRLVAFIYGERLIQVPDDAKRLRRSITLEEEYVSCSAGVVWREGVTVDVAPGAWSCP